MNDDHILERVKRCVGECLALDPAAIAATSSVVDDLGADSLDFIDILFALEKAFGLKLRSAQVESFLRADFSEGKLVDGRYVDAATLAQLRPWLPALAGEGAGEGGTAVRITPAQVYSFITVETFARIVAEAAAAVPGRP
jgi:acyl carrier protein